MSFYDAHVILIEPAISKRREPVQGLCRCAQVKDTIRNKEYSLLQSHSTHEFGHHCSYNHHFVFGRLSCIKTRSENPRYIELDL